MAFKFAVIFALAAVASAIPGEILGYHGQPGVVKSYVPAAVNSYAPAVVKSYAPALVKTVAAPIYKQAEYEAPAEYEFSYAVHDEHTGDMKSQKETRKGDSVQGYYELIEPDGHKRMVHYTADAHSGFNAIVTREETNVKIPQPAPQVHKVIAPVAKIAYAAPVAKVAYAAPVAKVAYAAAPVTKVAYSAPVAHYAPAPVSHYAPAPIAHYAAAPVAHYGAPVAKVVAPVAKVLAAAPVGYHSSGHESSHVTFNGPSSNYHY